MEENNLRSVLYIENDPIIIDVVRLFLRGHFSFESASSAVEGIEMTKKKQYSVILTDINLGKGMTGFQAAKVIKSQSNYKNVPIIATTAFSLPDFKEKILSEDGCSHILIKPFNKLQLLDLLNDLVPLKHVGVNEKIK